MDADQVAGLVEEILDGGYDVDYLRIPARSRRPKTVRVEYIDGGQRAEIILKTPADIEQLDLLRRG